MSVKITAATAALLIFIAAATSTQAQEAPDVCMTGPYSFANIPARADGILPSIERQISALGLRASLNGCQVKIVCGVTPETPQVARATCVRFARILERAASIPEEHLSTKMERKSPFGTIRVSLTR